MLEVDENALSPNMISRENTAMHSAEGHNAMDMLRLSDMLGGLSVEALETLAEEAKEVHIHPLTCRHNLSIKREHNLSLSSRPSRGVTEALQECAPT
eukprot:4151144-Pyramimonas_sp.AAC.1